MVLDIAIYYDCPNCREDWVRPINDDKDPKKELHRFRLYGNEHVLYVLDMPKDVIGLLSRELSFFQAKIDSCDNCGHLFDVRPRAKLMTYKQWKRYRLKKRILFWRKK